MSNVMIFLVFALVNFGLIALAYRLFGKRGILGYIVLSVIAANIQVNKGVLFDLGFVQLEATLGNIMFAGIFLATDLLNEKYGHKEAKRSVHISIFANLAFIAIMFISTLFKGLDYSQDASNALNLFFSINGGALKSVLVGNLVYLISQSLDVFIYNKLKEWNPSTKYLWLRNNGSTLISQTIDTILVTLGFALVGIFPMNVIGSMIVVTLSIKIIVSLLDTPFLYLMAKIKPRDGVDE